MRPPDPSHAFGPLAPHPRDPRRQTARCTGCGGELDRWDDGVTMQSLALEHPCGQREPDTALTMTADTLRLTGLATKPFGYVPPGRYSWLAMEGWDGVNRVLLVSAGAVTTTPVGEIGAYEELGSGTRVRPRRGAGGHTTG